MCIRDSLFVELVVDVVLTIAGGLPATEVGFLEHRPFPHGVQPFFASVAADAATAAGFFFGVGLATLAAREGRVRCLTVLAGRVDSYSAHTPEIWSSLRTVSVGWAPFDSHASALSLFTVISDGSDRGA